MSKIYFTPGPTQLYPGLETFIAEGLAEDIGSISHRSGQFKKVYAHTVSVLKEVLGLPDGYRVLFLGSATEAFERIAFNLIEKESLHFVNGSFSKRFYEYVEAAQKQPLLHEVGFGEAYELEDVNVGRNPELVAFTQNETSNGVAWPQDQIARLRSKFPDSLIAMDGVSSLPQPAVDFSQVDTALFSVQKGFGMPAGLGVWLVNERCVERAKELKSKGQMMGSHHDLLTMIKYGDKHQTPETPNVLLIYLLGRVCEQLLKRGIDRVRQEGIEKMNLLYDFVDQHPNLDVFVGPREWRSETVIVAKTEIPSSEVNLRLAPYHFEVGQGYSEHKESQLRIANFPAHSIHEVESLIESFRVIF